LAGSPSTDQWILNRLRSGQSIVLIDGIDELAHDRRDTFLDWLQKLLDLFPLTRFLVTSRDYAVDQAWFEEQNFVILDLLRMDLPSVIEFIDRWHTAAKAEVNTRSEKQMLDRRQDNIKSLLRNDRSLQRLMVNPLLCAIICALSRENEDNLPSRRIALYEAACKILVEDRDKQRGITSARLVVNGTNIDFNFEKRNKVLQQLAERMLRNGAKEITASKAKRIISESLPLLQITPNEATVAAVYRMLIERSGIVREPTAGRMDFLHATFQDYLAARQIVDEDDIGMLVERAEDNNFSNPIILVGSIANQMQQEELINGLLQRGDTTMQGGGWFYLLAMASTSEMVALSPSLRSKIQLRMYRVRRPANQMEAEAWAVAGQSAIPFLRRVDDTSKADACIRALSLIGGKDALEAISTYLGIDTWDVCDELSRAWRWFDAQEYVQRVLIHLPQIALDGNAKELIEELRKASQQLGRTLTGLAASNVGGIPYLSELTNLVSLTLDGWLASTAEDLQGMTQLRELLIYDASRLTDISAFCRLSYLEDLRLMSCSAVTSLDALSGLSSLKWLELSELPALRTLDPIRHLTSLQRLSVFGCPNADDLSPLADLQSVKILELGGCGTYEVSHIGKMKGVEKLVLWRGTRLIDPSFLACIRQPAPTLGKAKLNPKCVGCTIIVP